jgi:hypothetical protein
MACSSFDISDTMNAISNNDIRDIVFGHIDDDYAWCSYTGDFKVIIMKKNGYINAGKICRANGMLISGWKRNKNSKELLDVFATKNQIEPLISIRIGDNDVRGTYVHPKIIPSIASWISPRFHYEILEIIDEWRNQSNDNESAFWKKMKTSFDEDRDNPVAAGLENQWQQNVAREENGEVEVETECGRIDVLTSAKIIEIKHIDNWKHAVGQIRCYGYDYPEREKWIYLFNDSDDDVSHDVILKICYLENIKVKFLN